MRKRLFVHLGAPKTGSSSVQQFFHDERESLLADHRVYYPALVDAVGVPRRCANGAILHPEYFDRESVFAQINGWFELADTVILSEEVLFLPGGLKTIPILGDTGAEVIIVCHLRNAADYLCGMWMEFNRPENGITLEPLETYLDTRAYLASLGGLVRLIQSSPRFRYEILPYSPQTDTIRDLLQLLDVSGFTRTASRENVSLNRRACDIRQLSLRHEWALATCVISDTVADIAAQMTSGDPRPVIQTVDDDLIRKIVDEHAPFVSWVRKVAGCAHPIEDGVPECFGREREPYRPIDASEYSFIRAMLEDPYRETLYP